MRDHYDQLDLPVSSGALPETDCRAFRTLKWRLSFNYIPAGT